MKNFLIISILSCFLFACDDSKEESFEPELIIEAPDDKMELELILSGQESRSWVSSSFNLEMFGSLDCRTDDVFTFFNDGTYEYDGGTVLCGDSDNQQIVTGNWEVDLENNQIIFNKGTDAQATANYITVKEDLLRVMGSWNNLNIDAQYIRN